MDVYDYPERKDDCRARDNNKCRYNDVVRGDWRSTTLILAALSGRTFEMDPVHPEFVLGVVR